MDGILDVQVSCRSLDLSSSSDEHHLPHSFWAQACGLENQNTFVIIVHLGSIGISIVLFCVGVLGGSSTTVLPHPVQFVWDLETTTILVCVRW